MYLNRVQAKQNAFAIERYTVEYIESNIKKTDSINIEDLNKFPYEISTGEVIIKAVDQNSLFNLSWLIEPKSIEDTEEYNKHQSMISILRHMLSLCSLSTQIADQLNEIINNKNSTKHYITSKNNTRSENNYDIKKIFNISCINLLEDISIEDKQKLSRLVTVLPVEAKLNLNTAHKVILQSIDDLFGINISKIRNTSNKKYKNWQDVTNLFIDHNNDDIIASLKKLALGFNSNFISLYITSKNNGFSFFIKSDIFYSKHAKPKVISRELGPNYQWLSLDTENFANKQ
jgi:type II secretory pathway component PulK